MSACIEWLKFRQADGYGQIWAKPNRGMLAHRQAWIEANGPIPKGLQVLHKCDNPPCVNPDHLFLGTQADNNADMKAKGRASRGENHWKAKLTRQDAAAIRFAYADCDVTQQVLADAWGVSRSAIGAITTGVLWAHHE